MSDWTENEKEALRKLIALSEESPLWTPEETQIMKDFAKAWVGLRMFGRFLKWAVFVLAAIAGAFTAWDQIVERFHNG